MDPNEPSDKSQRLQGTDPRNRRQYQFTPEELRVLRECNKESFYQRCLPLSALLAGATYYGVQAGFLKRHARFGATPKVIVSVIVGYFMGKFSYQSKCAEKLMQLPHSHIGEMLRQKRRGNIRENIDTGFGPGISLAPFSGINTNETYSDVNPYSSLDMDTTRPDNPGLDDYNRPSIDNPSYEGLEELPPAQKHTTSYEELRAKNREEYKQKLFGKSSERKSQEPSIYNYNTNSNINTSKEQIESKNQYGDKWE